MASPTGFDARVAALKAPFIETTELSEHIDNALADENQLKPARVNGFQLLGTQTGTRSRVVEQNRRDG